MLQAAKYYSINLDLPRAVDNMRYRFKDTPLVYGIRCRATGMMYIGSTFAPQDRFHSHLVSGDSQRSWPELQNDISKYGIKSITVHIFELVEFPEDIPMWQHKAYLTQVEQSYIDKWPIHKRYNLRNSHVTK